MNRSEYLKKYNYIKLHNYLVKIIDAIDIASTKILKCKAWDQFLIRKIISNAPEVGYSALYSLTYIFFEELEEVSFRENDVTIGFNCYLRPNNQFEIKGAMASIFEEINFHYPTTQELSDNEKESIHQLSNCFVNLLMRFFEKELCYRQIAS